MNRPFLVSMWIVAAIFGLVCVVLVRQYPNINEIRAVPLLAGVAFGLLVSCINAKRLMSRRQRVAQDLELPPVSRDFIELPNARRMATVHEAQELYFLVAQTHHRRICASDGVSDDGRRALKMTHVIFDVARDSHERRRASSEPLPA